MDQFDLAFPSLDANDIANIIFVGSPACRILPGKLTLMRHERNSA